MEVKLHLFFFVCMFIAVINAKNVKSKPGVIEDTYGDLVDGDVQNDDYDSNYDLNEDTDDTPPEENNYTTKNAEFWTKPQVFIGHIGETILLPCETSDPDVVLVWQKDEKLFLYQGDVAMKDSPNMKKYPNGTLGINITSDMDFGHYACRMMISQNNSPEIVHLIVQPTPPKIISITTENNMTVYKVGDQLKLSCLATGYPKPKITWHKEGEIIGVEGESLMIDELKFKNAGMYRCLADNGIPTPAHSHLEIHIEHKPTVSIEKYTVNSDKEHDVELKCTVHAYPLPVVIWKKNGKNIVEKAPKIILKRHSNNIENILIIRNLTNEDFGEYACSAKNKYGKVEKTITLVKTPVVQGFVKPEKANRDVVLTWKIDSKSPISKHQLEYRKKDEDTWQNLEPEVTNENGVYTLKYTLKSLDPGSYETRVRSQNTHGWSEFSQVMPFEGVLAKNGLHHKPHNKKHQKEKEMKEKQVTSTTPATPLHPEIDHNESMEASQVGGCAAVVSSISMISIALLTLFYNRQ